MTRPSRQGFVNSQQQVGGCGWKRCTRTRWKRSTIGTRKEEKKKSNSNDCGNYNTTTTTIFTNTNTNNYKRLLLVSISCSLCRSSTHLLFIAVRMCFAFVYRRSLALSLTLALPLSLFLSPVTHAPPPPLSAIEPPVPLVVRIFICPVLSTNNHICFSLPDCLSRAIVLLLKVSVVSLVLLPVMYNAPAL